MKILKECINISIWTLTSICICLFIGSVSTIISASGFEFLGVSSDSNSLEIGSPQNIYFFTAMSQVETEDLTKNRMTIREDGNIGINSEGDANEKLYVDGYIRANNPTESNHAATKEYVDQQFTSDYETISLNNCNWSPTRYHSEYTTCRDYYGNGYVLAGIDLIESHGYIRYNRIYCCAIELSEQPESYNYTYYWKDLGNEAWTHCENSNNYHWCGNYGTGNDTSICGNDAGGNSCLFQHPDDSSVDCNESTYNDTYCEDVNCGEPAVVDRVWSCERS